jgi:hypothetical protein
VLRTSVDAGDLGSGEVASSYKALAQVERAFRAFNTDLDIRPIRHRTKDRVRAHVFLRMLSYYLTWHMQARLVPLLFTDHDKPAVRAASPSPVAPAARSPRALAKAATKQTPAELPVHSFATLLADLGTICLDTIAQPTPPCPASGSSPLPPLCSGRPSSCSPSASASGRVVSTPALRTPKTQVTGPTRGSLRGLRIKGSVRNYVRVCGPGTQVCVTRLQPSPHAARSPSLEGSCQRQRERKSRLPSSRMALPSRGVARRAANRPSDDAATADHVVNPGNLCAAMIPGWSCRLSDAPR